MRVGDYVGVAVFGGFGLWWALDPTSVLRFYSWFYRRATAGNREGRVRLPGPLAIRVLGCIWMVLVVTVTLVSAR